ncbi:MAG TPA: NAD(P)H-binding protein [bacterium]|nr:NAD(P)H-binding protein [bacterium]
MKLVLTGATGTAGSKALEAALADKRVKQVTVLTRRMLATRHAKLKVVLMKDFSDYSKVKKDLKGQDACLWCLGISQNAVPEDEYIRITYDYALAAAKALKAANKKFTFCFLSGDGAATSEKSPMLFGRVKGKTENALGKVGFTRLYHFRPGYIHPTKDQPKKLVYERLFEPLTPLLHRFVPSMIISSADLGKAMVQAACAGAPKTILDNLDILKLAKKN